MEDGFIYRPDLVAVDMGIMFNGPHVQQSTSVELCFTVTNPSQWTFFERCQQSGFPTDNSPIEAIMISDPNTEDMQHTIPFSIWMSSPLPTSPHR